MARIGEFKQRFQHCEKSPWHDDLLVVTSIDCMHLPSRSFGLGNLRLSVTSGHFPSVKRGRIDHDDACTSSFPRLQPLSGVSGVRGDPTDASLMTGGIHNINFLGIDVGWLPAGLFNKFGGAGDVMYRPMCSLMQDPFVQDLDSSASRLSEIGKCFGLSLPYVEDMLSELGP